MQIRCLIALGALGASVSASAAAEFEECGSKPPSPGTIALSQQLVEEPRAKLSSQIKANITIDTYFHVISATEIEDEGALTDKTVAAQMEVINSTYAPSGISFNLIEVTRTIKAEWLEANWGANTKTELQTALRKGSYHDLNLYFIPLAGSGGFCTFPEANVEPGSADFINDGCFVEFRSVPGGPVLRRNRGFTAVHEIGHWLGLWHTFQSGCEGEGDFVNDTPASRGQTMGCPIGRDSCPELPGLDPIQNYMDYSDDACKTEFSPGQTDRMREQWNAFRAPKNQTSRSN